MGVEKTSALLWAQGDRAKAGSQVLARRDIQGLRALAVVVVVLNHMLGWPSGGFVGVDIFFVISGFLITGLLLREFEKTGHISFAGFYKRRIKRILPAATLTLAAIVGLGFLILTRQRAISTAWDALWAFIFGANWDFAIRGVDYFQQGGAISPVQHFWSLSVEEQFYLVWPWLLLGLLILFSRFGAMSVAKMRIIAGITIGAITAASFGYALVISSASPTVAYFSSLTRVWELGVGALLAIVAPLLTHQRPALRTALAYAGVAGMLASCFVITETSQWPAPWALLPTFSATSTLMSGIGEEARGLFPLTNPVSVYVGDISYSLYLWHFPVIIFGQTLFPGGGLWTYVGMMVVGFGVAIAAFHVVEKPLWKSPLWQSGRNSRRAWRGWLLDYGPQMRLGGLGGLSIATAVLCALLIVRTAPATAVGSMPAPQGSSTAGATTSTIPTASLGGPVAMIQSEVLDALRSSSWPATLVPPLDELGPMSKAEQWVKDGCLGHDHAADPDPKANAKNCIYGDPKGGRTLVVWGDSVAISWVPGLVHTLAGRGWRILVYTQALCPAAMLSVNNGEGDSALPDCDEFRDWVVQQVKQVSPDYLLISQSAFGADRPLSGASGQKAKDDFLAAMNASLDATHGAARHIAIVDNPPATVSIEECYSAGGHPADCVRDIAADQRDLAWRYANLVQSRDDPSLEFLNVDRLFCAQGRCPAVVGGTIVRADRRHLTDAYSRHIGPALVQLLGIDT